MASASLITLTCHVFLVTAVTAGYAVTEVRNEPANANIGGGLMLWGGLGALGLPWSVLFFRVVDNERDNTVTALMVTFALANLLIHGLLAVLT